MSATEKPVTELTVYTDPAMVAGKAVLLHNPTTGDAIAFDASKLVATAKDLSMYSIDGTSLMLRETANSYVVRTTGVYKLPLVYGNAIKGGQTNSAAYTRQGSDYTAEFVNHLGNQITDPFIEKNANCQPASVGLLWQTGTNLITSVSLVEGGDCKYLQFTVSNVPTENGLAVLFVKDSGGRIMWSWTIWLTSDTLNEEVFKSAALAGAEYRLMPENLFSIWNAARTYCVCPHFQWGRKDAMVPASLASGSSNMTVYDISGNAISWASSATLGSSVIGVFGTDQDESSDKTVANAIKNPGIFFTRHNTTTNNWNNLSYFYNFWNAHMTSTSGQPADDQDSAVKTIYDPCPVGFMLPAARAFTGFTTTGNNSSDATQFNVVGSWASGWKFMRKTGDTQGNYFPASGYRAYDSGALTGVAGNGGYWSFAPYSQTYARRLYFGSGDVYPLYNGGRSGGFAVRPCRESN
jgi:hypothetical protein